MIRPGQVVILCTLGLLMIGVIMVNSADMAVRTASLESPTIATTTVPMMLASRSMVYMLLALAALLAASLLPVRALAGFAAGERGLRNAQPRPSLERDPRAGLWGLTIGALALVAFCALVYVPGIGREVNGSHRWVTVPGMGEQGFQPSEVAKWGLVIIMAWYCTRRAAVLGSFWLGLAPALVAIGLVAGFIVLEDLGTGALIAGVAALVLLAAGAKLWHFLVLAPIPLGAIVLAITTSDYRTARILAFLNPYNDPEGIGYHAIQSMVAIANGEGFGRGLGFGIQKLGYLPEDRTDFIFAILCEEMGIPGAAMVAVLYATLVFAGVRIALRERSSLLRLACLGVIATVGLQALINIAVVTAMAPTKGIALPLISSGGTGWVLTAFCLGLLVAVDRTQHHATPVPDAGSPQASSPTSQPAALAPALSSAMIEAKPAPQPQHSAQPPSIADALDGPGAPSIRPNPA